MVTFRISWISSTVKAGFEIASVQLPKGGFFSAKTLLLALLTL